MLQRVLPVEPGIERTMREYPIGYPRLERSVTKRHSRKTPDSVHNHSIKAPRILVKPIPKSRRKCIPPKIRLIQGMKGTRNVAQKCFRRIVQSNNLDIS